ncbi:hypothetical protein [uncultured Thomasclavelia sp.]|uniref:hypothetical protein n=1 Tax=uncultured Thomasclavelia sp. TaxID=3025759 RepID=UPI0025F6143A|nr:hypothetical protein [uncultured Thomasclavelia sp.]
MGFKEKYQDYKQKREARAFFNQHNYEKVKVGDWFVAFFVGVAITTVAGIILNVITNFLGFNLSLFAIIIGILQARGIQRVLNKSGQQLAIVSVFSFLIGIILGNAIYALMYIPFWGLPVIIELFKFCFRYFFTGSLQTLIIYLFGAIASYLSLKN